MGGAKLTLESEFDFAVKVSGWNSDVPAAWVNVKVPYMCSFWNSLSCFSGFES